MPGLHLLVRGNRWPSPNIHAVHNVRQCRTARAGTVVPIPAAGRPVVAGLLRSHARIRPPRRIRSPGCGAVADASDPDGPRCSEATACSAFPRSAASKRGQQREQGADRRPTPLRARQMVGAELNPRSHPSPILQIRTSVDRPRYAGVLPGHGRRYRKDGRLRKRATGSRSASPPGRTLAVECVRSVPGPRGRWRSALVIGSRGVSGPNFRDRMRHGNEFTWPLSGAAIAPQVGCGVPVVAGESTGLWRSRWLCG